MFIFFYFLLELTGISKDYGNSKLPPAQLVPLLHLNAKFLECVFTSPPVALHNAHSQRFILGPASSPSEPAALDAAGVRYAA